MSFLKNYLTPVLVSISTTIIVILMNYQYIGGKIFFQETTRRELAQSYRNSKIALTKSIKILARIEKEVDNFSFIQSDYFINQMDDAIESNGNFTNAQLVIEIYGDTLSQPIFDMIGNILNEIEEDFYRYKKRRELLKESSLNICDSYLNKKKKILNEHLFNLKALIAEENYLRQSVPVRNKELVCLRTGMQEDFIRYLNEDRESINNNSICIEEFTQEYSRHYDLSNPYYDMYRQLSDDPPIYFPDDSRVDSINDIYEARIFEKSLRVCK